MKFDIKALALACAILWGAAVLLTALANMIYPGYGQQFFNLLASIYPGFHSAHSFVQISLVTIYAAVDGLIGGAIFGWLYNCFLRVV